MIDTELLKAPFPWFGGKRTVAHLIWPRLGDVKNYVEPFYGSGAVHLLRPQSHKHTLETVNDYDGFVANFWRAIQHAPDEVAHYADWPVIESDLHARHIWLVKQREDLRERLEGVPDFYDAKIAGYWVWGICVWIGGEFCSGKGPWIEDGGKLVRNGGNGEGLKRKLVHLGDRGKGVHRQLVHLGDKGMGVHRKRVQLGGVGSGIGVHRQHGGLVEWFAALSERLRYVRVCSGDWSRVCGPTPTFKHGLTGVFLDPPYGEEATRADLYRIDSHTIAQDVRQWCIENGANPLMRIALCGYEGEHEELAALGWSSVAWGTNGGYANRSNGQGQVNKHRELIWFSPHCLGNLEHLPIFAAMSNERAEAQQ